VHDQLVEPAIVAGDTASAFKRQWMLPVHPEASLDDMGCSGFGPGKVAAFELQLDKNIVAPIVMDQRGAVFQRIPHRDDGGQFLELDLDKGGDVFGFGGAGAERHRNRLADMPDLVLGEHGPIRRLESGERRGRSNATDARKIGGRENLSFEAGRFLHAQDASMGMRAANEGRVQHAGKEDIGAKLPAAVEKTVVLEARKACSDTETAQALLLINDLNCSNCRSRTSNVRPRA
jgi:hypothetical protein